jgi:hypothetical protein
VGLESGSTTATCPMCRLRAAFQPSDASGDLHSATRPAGGCLLSGAALRSRQVSAPAVDNNIAKLLAISRWPSGIR